MRVAFGILISFLLTFGVAADTVIKNVTILPMDGKGATESATVIISGDRIVRINPQQQNMSADVIDGTGKYLIPGLAEMHGHLPFTGWSKDRTVDTLFLYLAGGVTTVRGMLGDPVQFELRDKITAGELDGPTLYLAAPSLNGNTVSSPEQGEQLLRRYAGESWDLQKIHPGLSRAEYDAIARAANELGFPFGGHVPADVGIKRALESGQISVDHMDGYIAWLNGDTHELSSIELQRAVGRTKASDTWIVPTQALFNTFYSGGGSHPLLPAETVDALINRPENAYVPKSQLASWTKTARAARPNPLVVRNRQRLLKAFTDGGINIAMGSDAPQTFSVPGFSIWREIEVMRDAGLTNTQILEIGTAAAGRYFADKDTFGTIAEGARADLILLDADPREDIMNITRQAGVMAAGRWYSREEIDRRLTQIAGKHKSD
jgi:imidazolonepropionase-like amidohydrolase